MVPTHEPSCMVDLCAADADGPGVFVAHWRWRILRRAGMCEPLASRVAITREIDPEQFTELVGRGCDPATAVRILAPDDWVFEANPSLSAWTKGVAS